MTLAWLTLCSTASSESHTSRPSGASTSIIFMAKGWRVALCSTRTTRLKLPRPIRALMSYLTGQKGNGDSLQHNYLMIHCCKALNVSPCSCSPDVWEYMFCTMLYSMQSRSNQYVWSWFRSPINKAILYASFELWDDEQCTCFPLKRNQFCSFNCF